MRVLIYCLPKKSLLTFLEMANIVAVLNNHFQIDPVFSM
jgi:hypothetical protein